MKIEDSRNFNSNEIVSFHTSPEKALKCQEVASFVAPVYVTKSPHQPDMECTETVTDRWNSLHLKKIAAAEIDGPMLENRVPSGGFGFDMNL